MALLVQLGQAVQSLGAGVALGVVSAEQVGRVVGELIGDPAAGGVGDG